MRLHRTAQGRLLRGHLLASVLCVLTARAQAAGVLISEIMYHPPGEGERDEYVELWNSGDSPVDIAQWKLRGGFEFELPSGARLEKDARTVIVRDMDRFREVHGAEIPVAGVFTGELKNAGETVELLDAAGSRVDAAAFSSEAPWPPGADGYGSSLERITTSTPATDAYGWTVSPPPKTIEEPPGTPGRPGPRLWPYVPPVVARVSWSPLVPRAGEALRIEALIRHGEPIETVEVAYRIAHEGSESEEARVPLERVPASGGVFAGTIPPQEAPRLVRFRVIARDRAGVERSEPSPDDLRPSFTAFVAPGDKPEKIPLAYLFHMDAAEARAAQSQSSAGPRGRRGPRGEGGPLPFERPRLERLLDVAPLWGAVLAENAVDAEALEKLRAVLRSEAKARKKTIDELLRSPSLEENARQNYAELIRREDARLREALTPILPSDVLKKAMAARAEGTRGQRGGFGIEPFVRLAVRLDPLAMFLATDTELTASVLADAGRRVYLELKAEEKNIIEKVKKLMAAGEPPIRVEEWAGDLQVKAESEFRKLLSPRDQTKLTRWQAAAARQAPFGGMGRGGGAANEAPGRGNAALCVVDLDGRVEVYDYVQAPTRSGGFKVKLHGDRMLRFVDPFQGAEARLRTVNLVYEPTPRSALAEPLSYEVFRRAGVPAPVTGHVRLWLDGSKVGYHLLVEQPNRAFLRRNGRSDKGNLYKLLWYGRGVVGQHEKKTNEASGHEDLVELLKALETTNVDEQWKVIEKSFQVDEVIAYFAVSLCLSNWDGFFNNYFTYHDVKGSGKWEIYPWDEDKTWGFYDGLAEGAVFFDMPLDYGQDGSVPPGSPPPEPGQPTQRGRFQGFVGDAMWWRPPGHFSGPFLANPKVRALYLERVARLLQTTCAEESMLPVIQALEERLLPEVRWRAEALDLNAEEELQRFQSDLAALRRHLTERRRFLLAQKDLQGG